MDWQEWGEEAFARAQRDDKPILLDIGAVWCHWCHVMDRESYEDAPTASMINELFVPIKVDRDERPDVDTRYQAAVAAISGQGGWPLTAFLTPQGRPFFGGTYFPREERYGRPSFQHVLRSMAGAYRSQRSDVLESADSVMTAIEQNESFTASGTELNEELLGKLLDAMLQQFDPRNGGFGSQPKFPHPAALDLLIDAASRWGPIAATARQVVESTLLRMADGGLHDQLAGGFHRYSVDEQWIVPHFEKLAYDNSELLRVYTHAFQSFGNTTFGEVAGRVIDWMDSCLSDRDLGGFYASQDADDSLDDDGDYFTWTRAEAAAVLDPEELAVAERFYNLRALGHMHHNPAKNVLHVTAPLAEVARQLGKREDDTRDLLATARLKLLSARLQRRAPYVDKTIYTGWNGLCISAYLAAGRVLARPEATDFALKSLNRVIAAAWDPAIGLSRVVAYGEAGAVGKAVPAVLEDYAYLAIAALDAWESTGQMGYFQAARQLTDTLLSRFYDETEGGFFDTARESAEPPLGALSARRKPLQDAPTPAGNPLASTLLLRLHALTGEEIYRERARDTLSTFASLVEHLGLYAASFGQALRRFLSSPVQICVVGTDSLAQRLLQGSTTPFLLNAAVIQLGHDQLGTLPPALALTIPHLPGLDPGECRGGL